LIGDIFQATLTAHEPVDVSSENVAEIVERRLRGLVTIRPQITIDQIVTVCIRQRLIDFSSFVYRIKAFRAEPLT